MRAGTLEDSNMPEEVKKQKPEKRQQRIQKTGVSWKQKEKRSFQENMDLLVSIPIWKLQKPKNTSYKYLKKDV